MTSRRMEDPFKKAKTPEQAVQRLMKFKQTQPKKVPPPRPTTPHPQLQRGPQRGAPPALPTAPHPQIPNVPQQRTPPPRPTTPHPALPRRGPPRDVNLVEREVTEMAHRLDAAHSEVLKAIGKDGLPVKLDAYKAQAGKTQALWREYDSLC